MGNHMACFWGAAGEPGRQRSKPKAKAKHAAQQLGSGGLRKRGDWENGVIEQQALAMALQQQHKAQLRFQRSVANRDPSVASTVVPPRKSYHGRTNGESKAEFKRSNSSRFRHIDDLLVDPQQLVHGSQYNHQTKGAAAYGEDQDVPQWICALRSLEDGVGRASIETKHFVLVHGGGLGAWCWYKSIALLEEAGLVATAIDLKGSGIDSTDPNQIPTMAVYVKPLLDFLEKLGSADKVILVAHNIGGACISHAMECFPSKVSKAIFVAAAMIQDGQRAFDLFVRQEKSQDDLMPKAQKFVYGNGTSSAPTAVELDRALLRDLFFNVSPAKDVALAMVSMRPIPFSPAMEKIALTPENYGSVRRFYIETAQDQALPPELQRNIIDQNPPERVFTLKGSDHSPFFSKPQSLHKTLVEIAMIAAKKEVLSCNTHDSTLQELHKEHEDTITPHVQA